MDSLGADSVLRMISFADVSKNLNSGAGFNFRNESYGQIYSILKQCGQHDFLRFSDSSTDLSYTFALNEAPLFNSCGIYFQSRSTSSLVYYDVKARCYLLILKKEDLVNEATLQKKWMNFVQSTRLVIPERFTLLLSMGILQKKVLWRMLTR